MVSVWRVMKRSSLDHGLHCEQCICEMEAKQAILITGIWRLPHHRALSKKLNIEVHRGEMLQLMHMNLIPCSYESGGEGIFYDESWVVVW
jgi:hypothetical protein